MKANRAVTSVVAAATALLVVVVGGSRAGAAEPEVVADWQMNESSSATVLADSSGNGLTGRIGSSVDTGVSSGGATVHRFDHIGTSDPADPERTHTVSDRAELDPGAGDNTFVVTVRYRATYTGRNMVQKGQSNTTGGMWKVEFEGGTGMVTATFEDQSAAAILFVLLVCEDLILEERFGSSQFRSGAIVFSLDAAQGSLGLGDFSGFLL